VQKYSRISQIAIFVLRHFILPHFVVDVVVTDLFRFTLVRALALLVNPTEVGYDDRDWQSDDQHAAQ